MVSFPSTSQTHQLIWKEPGGRCQGSHTNFIQMFKDPRLYTNVCCSGEGSSPLFWVITSQLFFFLPIQKKAVLVIYRQELRGEQAPANISHLLQGSWTTLEGSVDKYPRNPTESSKKFTFLSLPPNLRSSHTSATIFCSFLLLCFPLYLKTRYW